ncbi:MAG: carbohydrate ABC transporter permease [Planctomycetota bacterium]
MSAPAANEGSKRRERRRPIIGPRLRIVIIHALLVLACATTILPFLVVLTASLKCPSLGDDMSPAGPDFIPKRFHWTNYLVGWRAGKLGAAFRNSLMVSIVWTTGTVLVCAMAAYAIGRRQCFGHQWILLFFLSSMMFAGQTTMIPQFILYRSLGLYDSLAIFMIPGAGAFTIYLLSHWFKSVPKEIEEAALIDGCSEWGIFWRIIMPLSLPALATVGLFAIMGSWNNFVGPYVFLESEAKMTVPLAIQMFPVESMPLQAAKAAAVMISVVPVITVFVFLQRWVLKGLSLGALKG